MDEIFRETKSDPYYFEKRDSSVIIGVNIQKMSKWCFAPYMGSDTTDYGYDLMLTDLGNRYAISIGSEKGEKLLTKYAKNVTTALARDIQLVGQKKREIMNMPKQKFNFPTELIPELLRKNYEESSFWEKHSETCLACGSRSDGIGLGKGIKDKKLRLECCFKNFRNLRKKRFEQHTFELVEIG